VTGRLRADALVIIGVSAFSLSTMTLGASYYHDIYENRPLPLIADPANCLPPGFNKYKVNALIRNHFRCSRHAVLMQRRGCALLLASKAVEMFTSAPPARVWCTVVVSMEQTSGQQRSGEPGCCAACSYSQLHMASAQQTVARTSRAKRNVEIAQLLLLTDAAPCNSWLMQAGSRPTRSWLQLCDTT
jgi:hypothetical protein